MAAYSLSDINLYWIDSENFTIPKDQHFYSPWIIISFPNSNNINSIFVIMWLLRC